MRPRRPSLCARIVLIIVGAVFATSLIFGLAAFAIAYSMEDRLFQRAVAEEVAHQKASWARTGALAPLRNPDVVIYRSGQALPPDIRQEYADNPEQSEFFGREGRHYHVQRFELSSKGPGTSATPAAALMEVSGDLLVRPFRNSILEFLAWMSLLIAIVMAGLAWWFMNREMKPFGRLVRDVAEVQSAVPTIDAKNYPANEIGTLAQALEQAFDRIRDFVEREQAFTRDASHELRTPLAVVLGAAETMALRPDLPQHLVEPLRRIETATRDMTLALDQLLALARENKGVRKESVALRPMVEKAVSWSKSRYPDHAMTVTNAVDADAEVVVHPTSLQLVLNNLIGNCFQHVVTGRLAVAFDGNCLAISDDGPGLEAGEDAFAPFAKGTLSLGTGLGLDITSRLCDAANIQLIADRSAGLSGTSFRLVFEEL